MQRTVIHTPDRCIRTGEGVDELMQNGERPNKSYASYKGFRPNTMENGTLLELKFSRIIHLVYVHCVPRRVKTFHPHSFAVLALAGSCYHCALAFIYILNELKPDKKNNS